ncbi:hypothetical protein JCM8097_009432 [Rhodosporidiobolus ruineniae]
MSAASTPSAGSSSSTPTNEAQPPSSGALSAADLKRQHRAAKKAEQQARKDERKRVLLEQGFDPALLPSSLAGEFALNGTRNAVPKGFRPREWCEVRMEGEGDGGKNGEEGRKVKILSWNMLAQALVRRELFPGSDYLKGKDRLPALMEEVLYYAPDIACLQEVDRLSEHLPSLTLTHSYTSFVGYRQKAHGLLIAHKNSVFTKVGERGIRLDDLPINENAPQEEEQEKGENGAVAEAEEAGPSKDDPAVAVPNGSEAQGKPLTEKEKEIAARPPDASSSSPTLRAPRAAAGISRVTRNVGLFVALEFKDQPGKGVIVGTTHLFWAGEYVYERTRQTGILMREARRFRESDEKWKDWPVFLAGDFNFQPFELTYRLAVSPSASIPPSLLADFERSRVVHHSVSKLYDPSFEPPTPPAEEAKEGEGDGSDDPTLPRDKPIKNSRPGTKEEDGIVGLDELRALFALAGPEGARSAYGEAYGKCDGQERRWYCDRKPGVQAGNGWKVPEPEEEKAKRMEGSWEERIRRGDFEPIYSNFTPLWRCTLDYIFLLPPSTSSTSAPPAPQWRSLLEMHDFHEVAEPGLPRKGVSASDHTAVGAVVELY